MVAAVAKPTVQVGNIPRPSARRRTACATPSNWTNTTPGTSVTLAPSSTLTRLSRRRRSKYASSSSASSVEIAVVTTTRPTTMHERRPEAVDLDTGQQFQHPGDEHCVEDDRAEPERQHRERHDKESERGPDERVGETNHESGQQRVGRVSIVNPSRIAARTHSDTAMITVTTKCARAPDATTAGRRQPGRASMCARRPTGPPVVGSRASR